MELVIEMESVKSSNPHVSKEEREKLKLRRQIDLLYEAAGCGSETTSLGCYQRMLAVVMILSISTIGTVVYGLPFFEKIPLYQCQYGSNVWVNCSAKSTCDREAYGISDVRVNPYDHFSYHSIVE